MDPSTPLSLPKPIEHNPNKLKLALLENLYYDQPKLELKFKPSGHLGRGSATHSLQKSISPKNENGPLENALSKKADTFQSKSTEKA